MPIYKDILYYICIGIGVLKYYAFCREGPTEFFKLQYEIRSRAIAHYNIYYERVYNIKVILNFVYYIIYVLYDPAGLDTVAVAIMRIYSCILLYAVQSN